MLRLDEKIGDPEERHDRTKRFFGSLGLEPEEAMERLRRSNVTLVGVGGLNCSTAESLARYGVGKLTLIDGDVVEASNLNRQRLFSEDQVGMNKAAAAAERLMEINSSIKLVVREEFFTHINEEWEEWRHEEDFRDADVIISGVDSDACRIEVTMKALQHGKPHIDGSLGIQMGRVLVLRDPRTGPCFCCTMTSSGWKEIFKRWGCPEMPEEVAPSSITTASLVGEIMAFECIKLILGLSTIENALYFNVIDWKFDVVKFSKRPDCFVCGGDWWR